jgi:hypothetical protein
MKAYRKKQRPTLESLTDFAAHHGCTAIEVSRYTETETLGTAVRLAEVNQDPAIRRYRWDRQSETWQVDATIRVKASALALLNQKPVPWFEQTE